MSWTCRLVEDPPFDASGSYEDVLSMEIGDMFYVDKPEEWLRRRHLTQQFWDHTFKQRRPLKLVMPCFYGNKLGKQLFWIDGQCHDDEKGYYDGWTVLGTAPLITVTPSINMVGSYHGHLTNGVITDDVEGRREA